MQEEYCMEKWMRGRGAEGLPADGWLVPMAAMYWGRRSVGCKSSVPRAAFTSA